MKRNKDHFRGCMLGGAIGDALGWPVEFMHYDEIVSTYGIDGIKDFSFSKNKPAEITDDTQMTLFTAEGILRAKTRGHLKGICHPPSVGYYAYQRWLYTQGHSKNEQFDWIYDGYLLQVQELFHQRAPGNTCLSALVSETQGTIDRPINNSKGCGGVMRVAPAGLVYHSKRAFEYATEFAALTHGHPSGYLAAGTLAYMIAKIIEGSDLNEACFAAVNELEKHDGHEECSSLLHKAIFLSKNERDPLVAIPQLGEGWVAEEALAISIYCSLVNETDFEKAVIHAVNHDGDSDSTGAITGNILGAYLGVSRIPPQWQDAVELNDVITNVADDLLTGFEDSEEWMKKYPGY
ncbi:ADP-ribosylglycohydrolase family protein [Fredinandcohnia sp. 179-A 10B2 NHS]|uniref:ADP-ribosylglycohydrolase family protein n=1 Tax=Fredinandcohnia sp. 179-A 10B2 NHS TaxID=3235176 RepID=UPI0039A2F242